MATDRIRAGLRIDVDTLRGTRLGVPNLLALLARHGIRATFFFSVGPDNMGRHLWRLLRPAFLAKMVRSRAASLYGWDILFKGTLWPGPPIGERCGEVIRAAAAAGHEIGLHAWDHHRWQTELEAMTPETVAGELRRGLLTLGGILGRPVDCAAAPGWRMTGLALRAAEALHLRYSSDCRGGAVFCPCEAGESLATPQVPVTLPTYDECIGRNGVTMANYNDSLLAFFRSGGLNVLTIHAEVEGLACRGLFADFLARAAERHIVFSPLGDCLAAAAPVPCRGRIVRGTVPGREGWVAVQAEEES